MKTHKTKVDVDKFKWPAESSDQTKPLGEIGMLTVPMPRHSRSVPDPTNALRQITISTLHKI